MTDDDRTEESGRSVSRLGLIGGLAIAAMALYAVGSSLFGHDDGDRESASATPSVSAAASTAPAAMPSATSPGPASKDPDASLCGLKGDASTSLAQAPADVTWTLAGTAAVPDSKSAGPGVVTKRGVRYCFAHSPEGALLAAANVYSWGAAHAADPTGPVQHNVAAGPGYAQALAAVKAAGPDAATMTSTVQIRGFRMTAYTPDDALVDLAFQVDMGGYVHQQLELVWERGDWRLRLAPDGSMATPEGLDDLTSYTTWMGA